MALPDQLEIQPRDKPPKVTIRVPGSKSITNRALVLAALSSSGCSLYGALRCEDTEVMIAALEQLGFAVSVRWSDNFIHVSRTQSGPLIPAASADLHLANSGTSMRFLTAMVSLGEGTFRLDGIARMRERPIEDLLVALRRLGVDATSEQGNGCPPVVVTTRGLRGGFVRIKADISSQFLSALLMVAGLAKEDVEIQVDGPLVSEPYVVMTVAMMRQFGLTVEPFAVGAYRLPGGQTCTAREFLIEPDASSASYFLGAAAILQGELLVPGLTPASLQGDVRFADALERMGCSVTRGDAGLQVRGGPLRGIDIDMNAISDTVMTLASVACFAEGATTIRNVAHIRHKETDRLAALAAELRKVGAGVEEFADGLTIVPRPLHGARLETYNDHRMAMALSLIGLRIPGIVLLNPGCVAKTYPGFFDDLEKLR